MGRPSKPIERHLLEGTYREDRHGPVSADDLPESPPPRPAGLPADVAAKWDQLAGVLAGVVKGRDVPLLVEFARWLARSEKIAARLDAMKPADKGYAQTLTAAAITVDKLLHLSGRFGLTPADRAKLRAETAGPARAKVDSRPRQFEGEDGPPQGKPGRKR